jgi:hypothetical protein
LSCLPRTRRTAFRRTPVVDRTAPAYLPDAPFINRRYGDSAFTTFIGIEGGGIWGTNKFTNVTPQINIDGSGGVFGFNGGFLQAIGGFPVAVGTRVGVLFSNMSGSVANQPASPGFTYEALTRTITYAEVNTRVSFSEYKLPISSYAPATGENYDVSVNFSFGLALSHTKVTGTSGAFTVSDSNTTPGFTAAFGVQYPITQQFSAMAQIRGVWPERTRFNIPGSVEVAQNSYIASAGITRIFAPWDEPLFPY